MKWIDKLFNRPESGKVKLKFIALDENDEPYEDVAFMPYHDGYDQTVIETKFTKFMQLRKHIVVEITILEKLPNPD
jgi:hypothetical protein